MQELTADSIVTYLTFARPEWRDIAVAGLHRLPMGASRETFRFDLSWHDDDGPQAIKVPSALHSGQALGSAIS